MKQIEKLKFSRMFSEKKFCYEVPRTIANLKCFQLYKMGKTVTEVAFRLLYVKCNVFKNLVFMLSRSKTVTKTSKFLCSSD